MMKNPAKLLSRTGAFTKVTLKPAKTLASHLTFSLLNRFYSSLARDIPISAETGSCLVIAPHPDDETLGCGAAIIQARKAERDVHIIIITDGRAWPKSSLITPEVLAAMRHEETLRACEALGVAAENIIFLSVTDGEAMQQVDKIADDLLRQIERLSPSQIFSPYGCDTHADHIAVAAAMDKLVQSRAVTCRIYEYVIWFWPKQALWHLLFPYRLARLRRVSTKGLLDRKREALTRHRSQCENLTGEANWHVFSQHDLARFFRPYELFFEKRRP